MCSIAMNQSMSTSLHRAEQIGKPSDWQSDAD